MSAAVIAALRMIYPDSRARRVAREVGCSVRTARRIVEQGMAPRFRGRLLSVLDQAIERHETELRRLRAELRGLDADTRDPNPSADLVAGAMGQSAEVAADAAAPRAPAAVKAKP